MLGNILNSSWDNFPDLHFPQSFPRSISMFNNWFNHIFDGASDWVRDGSLLIFLYFHTFVSLRPALCLSRYFHNFPHMFRKHCTLAGFFMSVSLPNMHAVEQLLCMIFYYNEYFFFYLLNLNMVNEIIFIHVFKGLVIYTHKSFQKGYCLQ